jgi:DNA-binding response OmpR family regulator
MKILVADDSKAITSSLVKFLSMNDNVDKVNITNSIVATLSEIINNTPDVLILDIMFPDGSGLEVLQEAKNQEKIKTIIILTNFPYKTLKSKSLSMGADFFFDKSNEFEKVIDVINNLFNSSEDFK